MSELGADLDRWRRRRSTIDHRPSTAPPRVVILGAGMSGMCAAIRLRAAGITDITILERAEGVGGTWRDNHYPGSACDVPSHLYSFSFAPNPEWTQKYAPQSEILEYFERIARKFALLPLCRFGVEVESATFDADRAVWQLRCAGGDVVEAEVFIAATGQLNRPFIPPIDGLDSFTGTTFHSARWDHEHSLDGERVAVIGNGASAVQFVPPVAAAAASLTLFQRSANWVMPKPDRVFRSWERWAFRIPVVERVYRVSIWARLESRFTFMRRRSRVRDLVTRLAVPKLEQVVRPNLPRDAVVPDYPIGCKRILISNDWYLALLRPTSLTVTTPISRITPTGIETDDGVHREVDTIIFGTGFETTKFLTPITVTGIDGADLHETWASGASAHLGMSVPGFPNCFILYGPNTNLGHNSIIFMTERQVDYVVRCVQELWRRGPGQLDLRREVMVASERRTAELAADTVWLASCDSWYKTADGRLTNNWPARTTAYWRATTDGGPQDFTYTERRTVPANS